VGGATLGRREGTAAITVGAGALRPALSQGGWSLTYRWVAVGVGVYSISGGLGSPWRRGGCFVRHQRM